MDQKEPAIESAQEKTASPSAKAHDNKRKKQSPAQPWKKPPGFPKRYLSAYNLFFKQERERLLKVKQQANLELGEAEQRVPTKPELPNPNGSPKNGPRKHARSSGIGFANLARIVAKKWKELDPTLKKPFEEVADRDKERYKKEMVVWRAKQEQIKQATVAQEADENGPVDSSKPVSSQEDMSVPYDTQNGVQHGEDSLLSGARPHDNGIGRASTWNTFDSHLPAPDGNQPAKKPAVERNGVGSSWYGEPDRYGRSAFAPQHGRGPEGEYYGHPWWEGYHPSYGMPYPPPYGMPYPPTGRQMHGIPYRGGDGRGPPIPRPRVMHTGAEGPYNAGYYDRYYAMPPPGPPPGPFVPPPHQESPQAYRKLVSQPSYPPPSNVPPYGFQSHRSHNPAHEETWQRPASRESFDPPDPVSVESKRKRTPNPPASGDSQPLSIRNEDCSVYESVDTNLDNDTVDFLTTLELE